MDKYDFKMTKSKGCDENCSKTYFDMLCLDNNLQKKFFSSLEPDRKLKIIEFTNNEHKKEMYDPEIYNKLF